MNGRKLTGAYCNCNHLELKVPVNTLPKGNAAGLNYQECMALCTTVL